MKTILSLIVFTAAASVALGFPTYDPIADATTSGGSAYLSGSDLWKQTNAMGDPWFGANTGNSGGHVIITNVNLSYPGLPASSGNSVRFRNVSGGPGARMFVSKTTSGFFVTNVSATIYYSLVVQVPDITALATAATGQYNIGFNNQGSIGDQSGQPGIQAAGLYFKKTGSQYQVGIAKNPANANNPVFDSTLRNVGDILFIVAAYEIVYDDSIPSPTDDNVRLWVNPSSSSFGAGLPPAETVNVLATDPDINSVISSLVFLNRSATSPTVLLVDEVRIGKTWTFVTGGPEFSVGLPTNTLVPYNGTMNLAVAAQSGGPSGLTYRWQRYGTNLADGGTIAGSGTTNLIISNFTAADATAYSVIVSNATAAATNSTIAVILDPYISAHPTNKTVAPGATATFSVSAVGTPVLKYQWQRDGTNLPSGGNVSGATSSTLALSAVSANDVALYGCIVSNGVGNFVVSSNATLSLADPGFVSQPSNVTTNYGATVNFLAAAVGTPPLAYRWQQSGVDLSDGIASSGAVVSGSGTTNLTITGVSYLEAGSYTVFVTNGSSASLGSDPATLVVRDPYIITQPVGQTNVQGTTVNFTVSANGTPPVAYAWYQDNNALTDGGTILGAQSNHLVISSVNLTNIGNYNVIISSGSGSNVTSVTVPLKVILPPGTPLYWDGNGNSTGSGGAPTGTWGVDSFWNTDPNGEANPGGWSDASTAVFSAGTDSTATFTVTVNSTRAVTGINFEEGTTTLNSGTVSMIGGAGQSLFSVADGLTATFNTTVITGTNDLVKTGNGTLRMNANNTHTGRNIIRQGTVSVQGDSRWGSVPLSLQLDNIVLDGGILECNATGNPGQQNNGNRGIMITTNNGAIAETAANGTGAFTVFGVINGPGKLTKIGGSVLRIENSNTYTGGTDLNDGKIYVNANGGLGTGVLTINTNQATTMILRTTLGSPTTVTISNNIVLLPGANPLFSAGANGTTAHFQLSGIISGDGAFTRGVGGDKNLILTAANTYTGGTTVDQGILVVNNSTGSGTGTGTVTVNPAGALAGTGTIAGQVVTLGGTVAAGNSPGKLTLQNGMDMSAGGTNLWELAALKDDSTGVAGTDFDQLVLTSGALNANNGTLTLSFIGSVSAPDPTNSFWQAPHSWTVVSLSGSAANPGPSNFTFVEAPIGGAGTFTTTTTANGSIRLIFTPAGPLQSITGDLLSATISWDGITGVHYQLQYQTNLLATNWLVLTNITGAGALISVTDLHGPTPQRFYRLAIVP